MKKALFIFSGDRSDLEQLIKAGKAPDTQLYGMNHMSEEIEVEYKEFGDTVFGKIFGKVLGFRGRHTFMYFRTRGYDFVYGQSLVYTAVLKRLFGSGSRYVLLNTSLNRLLNTHQKASFTYRFAQWCLEGIEVVVCFSEMQRKELEEQHGIAPYKLKVIPFGVEVNFYEPIFSDRKEYLLAVGRDNGRDYKTVIETARRLPDREFKLILHPRNVVGIKNIPSNVHITYNASPEEVRKAYAEAAALLLITQPDNYKEGSDCSGQTVLLDACAAGIPIIATDKAYIHEYLTSNEEILLVPPHDAEAIIAAIQKIPEKGSAMAACARSKVEQEFSTKVLGERLSQIALAPWIIYVANARIPTQKAHGVQIIHTCEALAQSGAFVELVIPYRRTDIQADPYTYYSVEKRFAIRKISALDLIWAGSIGYRIHELMFTSGLRSYIRRFPSPQIVHVRGESVFVDIAALADSHYVFMESHIKQKNFGQALPLYKKAAGIIVVTKHYQKELIEAGIEEKKLLWAPDGVDLRLFNPARRDERRSELKLPSDRKIIGYIGKLTAMDEERGVQDLLDAFAAIHTENKNPYLLIVGATEKEILEVSAKLRNHDVPAEDFMIVGHMPHAVALAYTQAVDVLVMTYPNSAHHTYYLSPLKLFEYMASGVPIISTDLPSIRDILTEETAYFVPPSNSDALKEGIGYILTHEKEAHELAQQARADVTNYTWEARAQHMLAFIEQNI